MKKLLASVVLLGLVGAGCPSAPPKPSQGIAPVPARMGFGKLPALDVTGQLGTREATSARPVGLTSPASPVPMAASADAMMVEGSAIARPIPQPPNLRPVAIKYNVTATMPTWGTEGDVLEVQRMQTDMAMVRAYATAAGLPGPLVSGIAEVHSINVAWKDRDGYFWNTDGGNRMLNWWKEEGNVRLMMPEAVDDQQLVKKDDAKVLAAADAFLRAHGLGAVADQGATVEQYNYSQPCLMKGEVAAPDAAVSTMIYPSPCGYYPAQATVYYGSMREGKPVVDMGGWPSRISMVNVDVKTMQVSNGNVTYAESLARSAYPLLDSATVMKRLQEGGRNPVYPWGNETKDIQVTIDKVELAWLRFDSWADNRVQTYYIPAIAASGRVNRGISGQEPEEYHTTVALVQDDAFGEIEPQPTPVPLPMMEGGAAPALEPVKY